jgi:aryl-alcohol dehydrogenase-like predicted oxidoreductase
MESCENSLRALKTDHIDIYFLHRTDWNVPHEETLAALDLLVRQGKVRYIACSTHPAWRVVEGLWLAQTHGYPKFICEQSPYNLLDRRIENDLVAMCQAYDLGLVCWSPLAQGVLAGRYQDAARIPPQSRGSWKDIYGQRITQRGIEVAEKLAQLALDKNCSPAALAVAWVLAQPGVTGTIIGPRTQEQFSDLLSAADIRLTPKDLEFCDQLVPPGQFVSDHFNTSRWTKPVKFG